MDKLLMHWRAWGLMEAFCHKFGFPPVAPIGLRPAQLTRLMHKSLLSGELAAPLTLPPPRIRYNVMPGTIERITDAESGKLGEGYLDGLGAPGRP